MPGWDFAHAWYERDMNANHCILRMLDDTFSLGRIIYERKEQNHQMLRMNYFVFAHPNNVLLSLKDQTVFISSKCWKPIGCIFLVYKANFLLMHMYIQITSMFSASTEKVYEQMPVAHIRGRTFHYENTPIQIYWKFHHQNLKVYRYVKNSDIFHIYAQNIDCEYSFEPPRRGGSNEYIQSMFLSRNTKHNIYRCKPQFYYTNVRFKGVKII